MNASKAGVILIGIGALALLSGLGLDINICGLVFAIFFLYFGFRMLYMSNSDSAQTQAFIIPTSGATQAKIEINHGLGKLYVGAGRVADTVADGRITDGNDPVAELRGQEVRAKIGGANHVWPLFVTPWKWEALNWDLGLNANLPLELEVNSGLSDMDLDFSGLQLKKLKVAYGLGAAKIKLPASAGQSKVKVETGLSSLDISVPDHVAAKIKVEGFGGSHISGRFHKVGDYYQSLDYEAAINRVEITVEYGLGSVNIH